MLYLIIILACSAIIILANCAPAFTPALLLDNTLAVAVGVAAVIAIDGIEALVIRRLMPKRLFSPDARLFRVSKAEHRFYNLFAIKQWKDKVPQLGLFTGFDKGRIKSMSEKEYLTRFLLEANYGVAIHLANAILGFLIFFIPLCSSPSVWIPIFAVNLVLSLMPFAILRYNTYILYRLYKRSQKRTTNTTEET